MMITARLSDRMDLLYEEFEELKEDVNEFGKELGARLARPPFYILKMNRSIYNAYNRSKDLITRGGRLYEESIRQEGQKNGA